MNADTTQNKLRQRRQGNNGSVWCYSFDIPIQMVKILILS